MDIGDWLVRVMIAVCAIALIWLIIFAFPEQLERDSKAKQYGKEIGCRLVGHPRDLNTVYFFDCEGNIVMKRVN